MMEQLFLKTIIGQVRALDQFGSWSNKSNEELIIEKYVKTKEELRDIPVIADIDEMKIKEIRLIFSSSCARIRDQDRGNVLGSHGDES